MDDMAVLVPSDDKLCANGIWLVQLRQRPSLFFSLLIHRDSMLKASAKLILTSTNSLIYRTAPTLFLERSMSSRSGLGWVGGLGVGGLEGGIQGSKGKLATNGQRLQSAA